MCDTRYHNRADRERSHTRWTDNLQNLVCFFEFSITENLSEKKCKKIVFLVGSGIDVELITLLTPDCPQSVMNPFSESREKSIPCFVPD